MTSKIARWLHADSLIKSDAYPGYSKFNQILNRNYAIGGSAKTITARITVFNVYLFTCRRHGRRACISCGNPELANHFYSAAQRCGGACRRQPEKFDFLHRMFIRPKPMHILG